MSFHDRLADAAIRDGQTAGQFRRVAQKHANAFWFYAVVGAGIWYFFGFWWAVIPLALAVLVAVQSMSATQVAKKLEKRSAG